MLMEFSPCVECERAVRVSGPGNTIAGWTQLFPGGDWSIHRERNLLDDGIGRYRGIGACIARKAPGQSENRGCRQVEKNGKRSRGKPKAVRVPEEYEKPPLPTVDYAHTLSAPFAGSDFAYQ